MSKDTNIQRTFKETITFYEDLRQAVFEFTEEEFDGFGIRLSEISFADAVEADSWSTLWKNPKRITMWEWRSMFHDYHSNSGIKRFDIAVKIGGRLQLLCYGVPSRNKLILKVHALERSPVNNPLRGKVVDMTLFAADAYARLIDAEELWLCNPVSPAHVRLYQSFGFTPNFNNKNKATHLSMRIEP